MPLVEQELLSHPEYLSSPPVLSRVCFTRSLVLCICFVDRCLFFCTFSFGHCVCSSIYDSDYPFDISKRFFYECYRQWTEIPNVNTEFNNWILNKLLMDVLYCYSGTILLFLRIFNQIENKVQTIYQFQYC